jgi:pilus assembly protein CpaE
MSQIDPISLNGSCMFSTIVIHSGSARAHLLRYLVSAIDCLEIVRDLNHTPSDHEITRLIGSLEPDVVLIDLGEQEALTCAMQIREARSQTAIVGFGPTIETALSASKAGFDAVLKENCDVDEMRQAVQDALRAQQGGIEKSLYCFLPSKAGSGCSTVVLNTAAALARDEGKRVLVLDTDLRSGVLGIMLGVEPKGSIQIVLNNLNRMDKRRFHDFVHSAQGVDYLLSSRSLDATPPEWSDYFQLLSMLRGMYDAILVDMPELVNPASVELVRRAREIFVVATPEIPSLHLARHRCTELSRLTIPKTRIGLLINRWHKTDPSTDEIGKLVEHEVSRVFPNDYMGVRSAILSGRPVTARSKLGVAYSDFAAELIGKVPVHDTSITGKLKSFWGIRETVPLSQ